MRNLLGILLTAIIISTGIVSCRFNSTGSHNLSDSSMYQYPETLRVGTLYSPTSYFIYREEKMGYDYDLVLQLARDKGIAIDLKVAPNLSSLVTMLDTGAIDLAAYEIPITAEFRNRVIPCGIEDITHQVLIQPKRKDSLYISDVTQLVGRTIYVEKESKYAHRLANLNDELGGGIDIHTVNRDTLISDDMIDMVSTGEIPLTIVDSDIAMLNRTYYNNLDISLEVSFPQRSAWGVSSQKPWLADSIDNWVSSTEPRKAQAKLLKRYFELSKSAPSFNFDLSKGRISPYDNIFKRYAKDIGWDWRLLASQAYSESRFDSTVVSWAGARGIMQIMPATARAFGLSENEITNPERNIATAVKIIKSLDRSLSKHVLDSVERQKFVIAAYNSGIAHIYDAIALAKKYGKNPQIWHNNVSELLLLKAKPEYYNDSVCRYGYFRGRETTRYVHNVFDFYQRCQQHISQ